MAAAVKQAQAMTSEDDTLIVVTADHSHTLSMVGYPSRGNPILGKAAVGGRPLRDRNGLPFTTLSYANGPGVIFDGSRREFDGVTETAIEVPSENRGRRPNLTNVDTTRPGYMQEGIVPLVDETHGGEDVPIYAGGPHAYLFHGALEQHVVFHLMVEALGWN
jgi:alkaline phosphatase